MEFGPDERIQKKPEHMKLLKPIKPGFRRPFTLTPDEEVDVQGDGSFARAEVISGNSTVTFDAKASTNKSIKGWLNGDGATGSKSVQFVVDGKLGEGDQVVTLDVDYEVATPDATILAFAEGADEPIPSAELAANAAAKSAASAARNPVRTGYSTPR